MSYLLFIFKEKGSYVDQVASERDASDRNSLMRMLSLIPRSEPQA